jgi:spore germination protein GerM
MTSHLPGTAAVVRARALVVLVVLLAAVLGTGCGLSTNDEPEAIKDNVPSDLVDSEAAAPDGSQLSGLTATVHVWFTTTDADQNTRLVRRDREVPQPPTQSSVLEALIQDPPTNAERVDDISTAIPEDVKLTAQPQQRGDGVLIVNLSDAFYELQGATARNAFAQIVYTATQMPNVDMVQFELDGEPFTAVNGDGQAVTGPLGRSSYEKLKPEHEPAE